MFAKLLLLFVGLPLLEIVILIKLGQAMGFWSALLLVVGTGVVGALLARAQGLSIWMHIQQELQTGRIPGEQMVDGLLVLAGGIVLLTPGLITDLVGLVLLIPATRNIVKRWIRRKFREMSNLGETRLTYFIR